MSCENCKNCTCNSSLVHVNIQEFDDKIMLLTISELKELSAALKAKVQKSLINEDESTLMMSVKKLASVYRQIGE